MVSSEFLGCLLLNILFHVSPKQHCIEKIKQKVNILFYMVKYLHLINIKTELSGIHKYASMQSQPHEFYPNHCFLKSVVNNIPNSCFNFNKKKLRSLTLPDNRNLYKNQLKNKNQNIDGGNKEKDESLIKDYTNCSITFTYHFSEKIKENIFRTGSAIAKKKNLTTNSAIAISKQVESVQTTIIKSTPGEEHHA